VYNVIYLNTHDLGRMIEPYGYPVPTPNLVRLARQGTLLRKAFCAAPTCSPSRAALLTGMAAHSCGMTGLVHRGFSLTEEGKYAHLARFLRDKGYETVLAGIQHEIARGREAEIGYQKVLQAAPGADRDLGTAHSAAEYIRASKEKPFFLAVGLFNTHREFPPLDGSINPDYLMPLFPMYDSPAAREDMARFILSARIVDQCVGIILDALSAAGLDDKTIVLFTTDHGVAFPHCKCTLYDTGIGVATILRYPGNPMAGRATDALVSQLDLYPTFCDLLGFEKPQWLQGVSLAPLLEGKVDQVRSEIFAEVSYHAAYQPLRCIRTERYKLIRAYDNGHDGPVPANIDDSPSKTFLIEAGLLEEKPAREMLFDLYLDPVERVNRVGDERYRGVYDELSARLDAWMEATNDPLRAGSVVPKPDGAVVNAVTALSPKERPTA